MLFDVRDYGDPPTADYTGALGAGSMKALAFTCLRAWKQVREVQAFSRVGVGQVRDDVDSLIAWIASLSDAEFRDLLAGRMVLADLDTAARRPVDGVISANPDMSYVFLGNEDVTRVSLKPSLAMTYTDAASGATKCVQFEQYGHMRSPNVPAEPDLVRRGPRARALPLDAAPTGDLDFGKGEILTLHEIAGRAGRAFGAAYDVDGRIARSNYFVSGKYDAASFDEALEYVTAVPGAKPRTTAKDVSGEIERIKAMYRRLGPKGIDTTGLRYEMPASVLPQLNAIAAKYGAAEQLDTSGFFAQQTAPAAKLADGMPGFASFLQTSGVRPDTVLALDFTLVLVISCPGLHASSTFSYSINGGPQTPGVVSNVATMQLWAP